jgi:peptidylprolyl isomerase
MASVICGLLAGLAAGGLASSRSAHAGYVRSDRPVYTMRESNSQVFLQIAVDGGKISNGGRVTFELFDDTCPITTKNFRELCRGGHGTTAGGKDMSYKGSVFHRIIPGFMLQGGDYTAGDGTGGESIYGGQFADETFKGKAGSHHSRGMLSMANAAPDTNGSQFFITVAPAPWLDGRHVIFGQVIDGYSVVLDVEDLGTKLGKTKKRAWIKDCGVL